MTRSAHSAHRRRRIPPWRVLVLVVLGVVLLTSPVHASAPVDGRGTGPNHPSELAGAGYLLSDPSQGGSYWAGAYRTIPSERSYCVDDFYDYPNPSYGYVAPEVSSWPGRDRSNGGAQGRTAQRIIWIVNTYGSSTSPDTDAAVSMAINLLTGAAPFRRSYAGYFERQLNAINPQIVRSVNAMIADSYRYSGPYATVVKFGAAPPVNGSGTFTVSVHAASGAPLPNTQFRVIATAGIRLATTAVGRTGADGIATLYYLATRTGAISVAAEGVAVPNTTMRLAYSPTHYPGNLNTGSQRVALASATRLRSVAPAAARTTVAAPSLHTVVHGGEGARTVGTPVLDQVTGSGLVPNAGYVLEVTLRDSSQLICGTKSFVVHADRAGRLLTLTPAIGTCGGGRDTFAERLLTGAGRVVAISAPGQPLETFPVRPAASTSVIAGFGARVVGTPVRDRVLAVGLQASASYRVTATLVDSTGAVCGSGTVVARSDSHGRLAVDSAPIRACGKLRNTFTEQVVDQRGVVLIRTPRWQPTETFPLRKPVVVVVPTPPATPPATSPPATSPPATSAPPTATPTPTRSTSAPNAKPTVTPTPRLAKVVPTASASPTPQLAMTGSTPKLGLGLGLCGVLLGVGLLLLAGRRGPRRG